MNDGPADLRLPDFVVVGCPRAGTTTIWHLLDQHPQVSMSGTKEIHFFDRQYDRGLPWYSSHFIGLSGQVVGEATPNYVNDSFAIQRLVETVPDVRLILSVRDPVERLHSHYWMRHARGNQVKSFDELVREQLLQGGGEFLATSEYGRIAAKAQDVAGVEQVLVLCLEDLSAQPAVESRRLFDHLGVESLVVHELPHANSYASFRSLRLRRALKRSGSKLPAVLRTGVARLNTRKTDEYPPIDPALDRALRDFYAADMDLFEELTDIDTARWR